LLVSLPSLRPPPTSTLFPYTTLFRSALHTLYMDRVKQLVGGGVAQLGIMPENDQLAHGHFAAGRAVVVFEHIQDRFPQELQILLRKAGDLAGQVGRDE